MTLYTLVIYACLGGISDDPGKCRSIELDPQPIKVCDAMKRLAIASLEEDDYSVFAVCAPTAEKREARK